MITPTAAEVFQDNILQNVPGSTAKKVSKAQARAWGAALEALLNAGVGSVAVTTLAQLNVKLGHDADTSAMVWNDGAPADNGLYAKVGPSGFGSWTRIGDLPFAIVPLTVTGGTANAVIATGPEVPLQPSRKLYTLVPGSNNTAAASLSTDGGATYIPIKNNLGFDLAANSLVADSPVIMIRTPDRFQLVTSAAVDANSVLAATLAAQTAAQGYATAAAASASALGNEVHQYDTLAEAAAATIPGGVGMVRTLGRGTVGIGGASWTRCSAPGTPRSWHFQNTHDNQWWIMTVGWFVKAVMFSTTPTNAGIEDALDYLNTFGLTGGRVTLEPNQIYTGTVAPVVWSGLTLDGNGSKIESTLSGNGRSACGLAVLDNAEFRNGWAHTIDGGITGLQALYGAGISFGEANGATGNLVGSPTVFASYSRPRLRNVKASTTRVGGQAVQVAGDVDFDIDGLEVPDLGVMGGAFSADWSDIGGTTVAPGTGVGGAYVSDLERLTNWRNAFNDGDVITTHPRGSIRRFRSGALTNGTTQNGCLRFSACHDIIVTDASNKEISGPIVNVVGGDFGFEFAAANVKPLAYRNMRFSGLRSDKCNDWGIYVDTWADNLAAAIALGYVSLTAAVSHGDIVIDGFVISGTFDSGASDGIRLQHAKDVKLLNGKIAGFANGIGIEAEAESCDIAGCLIFANRTLGISVDAAASIKRINIKANDIRGNGTSGSGFAAIRVSGGDKIVVDGNLLGGDTETTQQYGVQVDVTVAAASVTLTNNEVRGVKSGGTPFLLGAGGSDVLWLEKGNRYSGPEAMYSGQTIFPIERTARIAGATGSSAHHTRYICAAVNMSAGVTPPSGPVYVQGDLVEVPDAASSACVLARRGASTWGQLIVAP